ncbi:hypothetical protein KSD_62580 [Ktedonobacter sp. SOSP1-85]|nr:hypothetical protein KSD_62580 [Ktedonobacter sp. SOSP1-85]
MADTGVRKEASTSRNVILTASAYALLRKPSIVGTAKAHAAPTAQRPQHRYMRSYLEIREHFAVVSATWVIPVC